MMKIIIKTCIQPYFNGWVSYGSWEMVQEKEISIPEKDAKL